MNGYEVTVEDLRRTAAKYDALREDLEASKMPHSALAPERAGHIEVASWQKKVLSQAQDVHDGLGKDLESLAEYLRDKARDYEQADLNSAELMKPGSWAEGGESSKLTPLPHALGQSSRNMQPLPNIYGQDGAQFSPLTPPPSVPKAE
ncbi:hypothetical protein WBG06_10590 [Nocardioides sp. CCNWLW239]|uniref:hypothetical protein n=1 Tax=Nocardioides sp. CCNWLW239 TaxID=3128902 RepID=UPI003016F2BC